MRNRLRRLATICIGTASCLAFTASAQIYSPLHIFSAATGSVAPLTQGADGTLYGVSVYGGVSGSLGFGTVFKVQPDGSGFGIIYSFTNGTDGSGPAAGLIVSGNTLYGTAENGGSGGHGTVFKVNTDGSGFVTIYSFTANTHGTNSDGANPVASLVLSGNTLYGTASAGGSANSYGTIFKVNTDGTGFTNLHTFGLAGAGDPAYPLAGMVLTGSTLYGTTEGGGTNGYGTVFKIDISGTGFATVHTFPATVSGTNSDGSRPEAGVVLSGGILYGTTSSGGRGYGTVFSLNTVDSGFTNLYNFTNGVDGSTPLAALALSEGTLYGTASSGGTNSPGWGTVFKLNTDGTGFTNLYEFAQGKGGTRPMAGLLLAGSTLYGTTPDTGTGGVNSGTVFKLNTDGSGYTVLDNGGDGAQPQGGLVLSGDSFYGTTSAGGSAGEGIVFKMDTNGTGFTTLHTFSVATYDPGSGGNFYTNFDGATPLGTLVSSGDVLYGTTVIGGAFGGGTVFRVNTDGTAFTNLYSFTNGSGGGEPQAGLVLSGNAVYGTASSSFNSGTIFKINTDGTGFTNLYNFSALVNNTNSDGNFPLSGLVLGGDTLYGTTLYGGPGGEGTLFKINTNGTGFTNIYNFNAGSFTNLLDGVDPISGLIVSGNTLYGTTSSSITVAHSKGGGGPGTVFKVNTDGTSFVKLRTFTNTFDGSGPKGALVLSGGKLYGTASSGGNGLAGTVFQLNTDGTGFTTLHTFPFQQGTPVGDLVAIGNTVYGTSEYGAPASASSLPGSGSVFAVTPTATPSIQFTASPTNGIPPQGVQFSAPGVDDNGNTILAWYWNFGDGTPAFTITTNRSGSILTNYISTQNPLHTYTNNGPFFPALTAVNINGTSNIIGSGPVIAIVYPSSILNGGFEAGTFTNWTSGGSFGSQSISTAANYRHAGTYGAQLTASGALRFLSQTLSTTPGAVYTISFWMHNPTSHTNNEFQVSWNGNVLLDMANLPVSGWTNIQLTVTATAAVSVLQFGYRNDTAYFGLDDITVSSSQPLGISGISLSGANLMLNGTGGLNGRTYFVLMGTNLSEPFDQWTPVATNLPGADGNFSIIATNAMNPNVQQRFYILQLQ
jgi:uncharacterized repeat protein (TIGR03803 family)